MTEFDKYTGIIRDSERLTNISDQTPMDKGEVLLVATVYNNALLCTGRLSFGLFVQRFCISPQSVLSADTKALDEKCWCLDR